MSAASLTAEHVLMAVFLGLTVAIQVALAILRLRQARVLRSEGRPVPRLFIVQWAGAAVLVVLAVVFAALLVGA